jgi:3-phenylpropionate/trans-cinnamate dioxygenase ferredoxin reductase component
LYLGEGVAEIRRQGDSLVLETNRGTIHQADTIVAGIGVVPNAELAEQSGLACRDGIIVDVHGLTNDADIVAAGDCTMHYNGFLSREIRLESVQNAVDQAKIAAASLCGQDKAYDVVPWFWSDQYEVKLQMAGVGMPHDQSAVRGVIGAGGFSIFYFKDGALIGADSVNCPADHMACRKLLAKGTAIAPEQVRNPQFNLKQAAQA